MIASNREETPSPFANLLLSDRSRPADEISDSLSALISIENPGEAVDRITVRADDSSECETIDFRGRYGGKSWPDGSAGAAMDRIYSPVRESVPGSSVLRLSARVSSNFLNSRCLARLEELLTRKLQKDAAKFNFESFLNSCSESAEFSQISFKHFF